jgi:hypothetical protein
MTVSRVPERPQRQFQRAKAARQGPQVSSKAAAKQTPHRIAPPTVRLQAGMSPDAAEKTAVGRAAA